ncbi:MAG: CYTH domain-containing protein [Olegusella sp.]|nr:CYTH domain-containing protein [Olegusella sp.]
MADRFDKAVYLVRLQVSDPRSVRGHAVAYAANDPDPFKQTDQYYRAQGKTLVLRTAGDSRVELITLQATSTPHVFSREVKHLRTGFQTDSYLTIQYGRGPEVVTERRTYRVEEALVHLDNVRGLGDYVEIEAAVGSEDDIRRARRLVNEIIANLGLTDERKVEETYGELAGAAIDARDGMDGVDEKDYAELRMRRWGVEPVRNEKVADSREEGLRMALTPGVVAVLIALVVAAFAVQPLLDRFGAGGDARAGAADAGDAPIVIAQDEVLETHEVASSTQPDGSEAWLIVTYDADGEEMLHVWERTADGLVLADYYPSNTQVVYDAQADGTGADGTQADGTQADNAGADGAQASGDGAGDARVEDIGERYKSADGDETQRVVRHVIHLPADAASVYVTQDALGDEG